MQTRLWMIVTTAAVAMGLGGSAPAATLNWTGTTGSNWTDSANWVLAAGEDVDNIPDADDDVVFPTGAVYTAGVYLNGDQACNSLTINSNMTSYMVGGTGLTLTVTSGALSRLGGGNGTAYSPQHRITCNLVLQSPDGTNVITVQGGQGYNVPNQEFLIEGRITAAGRLRKTGTYGKLTLANTNSFGDSPLLEGGTLESKNVLVSEALGTGTIYIAPSARLYIRGKNQTVSNSFVVTASGSAAQIANYSSVVTLLGNVDVQSGRTFTFGDSWSTAMAPSLMILSNRVTGTGNLVENRNGTVFTSTNQFTTGNLLVGNSGGGLILDNISWTTFTNHYTNYGAGNRQWQLGGGGFGARTTPLTITGGTTNSRTWFNTTFSLGGGGSSMQDSTVRLYANAPVTVALDTELTGRQLWNSSAAAGPGVNGTHNNAALNRVTGRLTDALASGTGTNRGAFRIEGNFVNDELILAGTNDWTGSYGNTALYAGALGNCSVNSGPGGLVLTIASGNGMYVQFDGNASLPRGNGGSNAWLNASARQSGQEGFFLAAKDGGETYVLRPGYKFLLGSNGDDYPGGLIGTLGGSGDPGTSATLQDSAVCIHSGQAIDTNLMDLVVRGASEFVLGTPGAGTNGAVLLQPSWGYDSTNYDSGLGGVATVVSNTLAPRPLRKRGDGTLVLQHVDYTTVDGTGDTHTQFTWQVGLASGYVNFDGAVRETGDTLENSTADFPLTLAGGVLELGFGDFTRPVTNIPLAGYVRFTAGCGFSAYGTDRRVNLNSGALFDWNNQAIGYPSSSYPLIFGSRTANATLVFENPITLMTSGRRAMATVRGTGSTPEGRITGQITGAGAGMDVTNLLTRLNEPIPAGTLELAHTNNTFTGPVNVYCGTLLVNGGLLAGSTTITVHNAATLDGTGTVVRPVTVLAGGTALINGTYTNRISVGAGGVLGGSGTLAASNLTLNAGAKWRVTVLDSEGATDALSISGSLNVTNLALEVANTNLLTLGQTYRVVNCDSHTNQFASSNLPENWLIDYRNPGWIQVRASIYPGTLLKLR